jgi:Leucine-rich repeat (LRR) protein
MVSINKNNLKVILNQTDLSSLTEVDLSEKDITSLVDEVFENLINSKIINLNFNQIFSINSKTFDGLRNLTTLYLKGMYSFGTNVFILYSYINTFLIF